MKLCKKCQIEKELIEFYKYRAVCKKCLKEDISKRDTKIEYLRKYYKKNRKELLEQKKKYRKDNIEKELQRERESYHKHKDKKLIKSKERYKNNKEYIINRQKIYANKNRDKINLNIRNRKLNDTLFKLKISIRGIISTRLKNGGYSKKSKANYILGCSYEEFKLYLESKFEPWMNWDNWGKYNGELNYGWDIDHIIPLSSAKCEEDLIKLFHFSNLQPLDSKINRDIKKDKIIS